MIARLRSLSPFGPIFGKELRIASRRKRNHALRVLYLAALLLILLIVHATVYESSATSITERVERQARLGEGFFGAFTIFSIVAMGLVGPIVTSTAIGAEKLGKTLHVLLMTPMNTWQIVAGKLMSRIFLALMLIGLSLPVLALVRLLGGVEIWQMAAAIAAATAVGLFSASIGLWLSTFINRGYVVILSTYGLMGILYVMPFILMMLAFRGAPPTSAVVNAVFYVITATNPIFAGVLILSGMSSGGRGLTPFFMAPWWHNAIFHAISAFFFVALAARTLRRQQRREGQIDPRLEHVAYNAEPMVPSTTDATTAAEAAAPVAELTGAAASAAVVTPTLQPSRTRHRDIGDNPILWRELRQRVFQRRWLRVVTWTILSLVLGGLYLSLGGLDTLRHSDTHIFFGGLYNVILWLLVAVLSATAISHEKESDTWTLLLATPLPARTIVWGKVWGLMWRLKFAVALVVVHFLLCWLTGVFSATLTFIVLWTILTFNTIWIATGLYLSLRMKSATVAVVVNLLLAVFLYAIVTSVEAIIHETFNAQDNNGPYAGLLVPYFYIVNSIDELGGETAATATIDLPGFGWRVSGTVFAQVTFFVGLGHLAVSWYLLRRTARRFDKIVGRAQQREKLTPTAS